MAAMIAATVLVPTHNHGETLRYSVGSALRQTLADFELFIVGDGCDDATRRVALELAASDRRVRFLDLPKGPRKGEAHRHSALGDAQGRIVAYLGDDDLWFPDHLERLELLLRDADFGHTLHAGLDASGAPFFLACDLGNPDVRRSMLTQGINRFDLTFGGHTLAAYHRLPGGWHRVPVETPTADRSFWQQFLAEPWCRARSVMVPTGLCSQTHLRPHLSVAKRAAELSRWTARIAKPGFTAEFYRLAIESLNRAAVAEQMAGGAAKERLAEEQIRRRRMKRSWSWRITKPLRKAGRLVGL
jgi:GalNAc5-diNAcBac-PP-undecaprenol beta-1,3-glucosyltransferase